MPLFCSRVSPRTWTNWPKARRPPPFCLELITQTCLYSQQSGYSARLPRDSLWHCRRTSQKEPYAFHPWQLLVEPRLTKSDRNKEQGGMCVPISQNLDPQSSYEPGSKLLWKGMQGSCRVPIKVLLGGR